MEHIRRILLIIPAAAVMLSSCMKEDYIHTCFPAEGRDGGETRSVSVSCTVPGGEVDTKSSYAAGESSVKNISLFVFDASGALVTSGYHTTASGISLSLPTGTYGIWAVANMGDVTPSIASLSALRGYTGTVSNTSLGSAFPMSGGGSYTIGATTTSVSILLERLVAKYTFSLDTSDITEGTLTLKSVALRNIAGAVRPLSAWGVTSASQLLSTGDTSSSQDVTQLNSSGQAVFYVPENCQGTESGISAPADKVPTWSFRTVNPALCTYLEVNCTYVKNTEIDEVTYRMYLGANATTSFDVQRNRSYNVILQPSSSNIHAGTWKCDASVVATVAIYNNASRLTERASQLTVGENCFMVIQNISGDIIPISSCSSDDRDFTATISNYTVARKTGACASLLLSAARSSTYHVTTTSGLSLDVEVTANKPQVSIPHMGYVTMDGHSVAGSPVWSKSDGTAISNPATFFNSVSAKKAFNNTMSLSCSSATRQVSFSPSTTATVSSSAAATVGRCMGLFFGDDMSKVYLRLDNYDSGGLKRVLDAEQTGGYYRLVPVLKVDCPNLVVNSTFTCYIPWTNKPGTKISTAVHDYSIIPQRDLATGLSRNGSISGLLPYRMSLYEIPVVATLSRNSYTSYTSGVTYSIAGNGKSVDYMFNGTKHPAGLHSLSARLTNAVSGETLDVALGYLDCYCHIPVGTEVTVSSVGQGGPWYDQSSMETCLWVDMGLTAHWPYTCSSSQDYPVYKLQSDMKNNSAARAMIRGTVTSSSETSTATAGSGVDNSDLQRWGFYEPYDYPGCNGGCDLWVNGTYDNHGETVTGNIGDISDYRYYPSQDDMFRLNCHYTETIGNYYQLYDYTGSTTTGSWVREAHWPFNSNYDDSGKGYYIVEKIQYLTRYSNYLEYLYGM